jgi:SAM-dependent methyltransferase
MAADKDIRVDAWDATYQDAGLDRLWPKEPTIEALDFSSWREMRFHTILDAGCGDGKNLAYLIRQGFVGIGADASQCALLKCHRYLQAQGLPRDYVLLAPVLLDAIPLLDESVDAVICVDVLGHLEKPLPVLHELARVVRPGGCMYASVFHVEDGCRTGPRMRPGKHTQQFWYKGTGALNVDYYFRFYDESEACELFKSSGLRLNSIVSRRWQEPPHLGYRDEWHEHQSWFAVLQKASP